MKRLSSTSLRSVEPSGDEINQETAVGIQKAPRTDYLAEPLPTTANATGHSYRTQPRSDGIEQA